MARGPLSFKQADVTRVVKAARQAKLENFRVKDGRIVLDVKETGIERWQRVTGRSAVNAVGGHRFERAAGAATTTHEAASGDRQAPMSDNEAKPSPEIDGDEYKVGYGRPPKHSRFAPGRSGNSAGRRKAVRNLMTDVVRTLKVPINVKEGGRSRKISTQEGALLLLREKA